MSNSPMIPLHAEVQRDWFGEGFLPPVRFSIRLSEETLVFEATRDSPAISAPGTSSGQFAAELWKHDVAELFLLDRGSGRYLECNLAPNGAWWTCWFDAPRLVSPRQPEFAGVRGKCTPNESGWQASLQIPLSLLPPLETLSWNATFILESPAQRFVTYHDLGGGTPDFHRPAHFQPFAA